MGINYDIQKLLVHAFETLSPSDFVKSKILLVGFRAFLERGTIGDCLELIPNTHKAAIWKATQSKVLVNSNDASNLMGTNSTEDIPPTSSPPPSATIQYSPPQTTQTNTKKALLSLDCIARPQPAADSLLSTPTAAIANDLVIQTRGNDPKRIQRLVQAIEALKSAAPLSVESYEKLWSAREGFFIGTESGLSGWMCRLQRGRKKIDVSIREIDCASRLSLMLMPQFVDYTEKWEDLPLKSGYGRRSAAFEKAARDCNIPLATLKQDSIRTGNYFYLLQKVGPGHLLELGSRVTSLWEKYLSQQDVDEILAYRKAKLPELEKRATSLNGIGARTLHACLIDCGWTSEALSKPTRLTNSIRRYQNELNPAEVGINDDHGLSQKRDRDNGCKLPDTLELDSSHHTHQFPTSPLGTSGNLTGTMQIDPSPPIKRLKKSTRRATKSTTKQRRISVETCARSQLRSVGSSLDEGGSSTCTSPSADLTSTRLTVMGQLCLGLETSQDASVSSTTDPAVEAVVRERLTRKDSLPLPEIIVPGPNDRTEGSNAQSSGPITTFPLLASETENPETLNASNNLTSLDTYDQTTFDYNNAYDLRNLAFDYNNAYDLRNLAFDYNNAYDLRNLTFDYNNACEW